MAKKPMTKSQIVSHFAGKFEISKKSSQRSLTRLQLWQSPKPRRPAPLPFLELGNWSW